MNRLKTALEQLDEMISALEDRMGVDAYSKLETQKKQAEQLRLSRSREANVLAIAQKVATRLDQTIQHVENVLRD